jgi:hypothetical protein
MTKPNDVYRNSASPPCYPSLAQCLCDRPETLTDSRVKSFLPNVGRVWPRSQPTEHEATWMTELMTFGTWRWFAKTLTGDDQNQITGMDLEEAANRALGRGIDG